MRKKWYRSSHSPGSHCLQSTTLQVLSRQETGFQHPRSQPVMHSATKMGSALLLPTPTPPPQISLQLANSDQQEFCKTGLQLACTEARVGGGLLKVTWIWWFCWVIRNAGLLLLFWLRISDWCDSFNRSLKMSAGVALYVVVGKSVGSECFRSIKLPELQGRRESSWQEVSGGTISRELDGRRNLAHYICLSSCVGDHSENFTCWKSHHFLPTSSFLTNQVKLYSLFSFLFYLSLFFFFHYRWLQSGALLG